MGTWKPNRQGRVMLGAMLAAIVALTIAGGAGGAVARADGAWLDQQPLQNWNQPGMPIPHAPVVPAGEGDIRQGDFPPTCLGTIRQPQTDEDSAVAARGWHLVGAFQGGYGAMIVIGTSSFDGMCRPVGFQEFVFFHQTFIGTISPQLMDSRTDGVVQDVNISPSFSGMTPAAPSLTASFSRYTANDALCCPSAVSTVNYEIQRAPAGWVLVPKDASTMPTSSE
ncbi:MAG: LppP/LprE family lipoprotein [Dehalococcoidia bacterium]